MQGVVEVFVGVAPREWVTRRKLIIISWKDENHSKSYYEDKMGRVE